jgi:hypothetical protein
MKKRFITIHGHMNIKLSHHLFFPWRWRQVSLKPLAYFTPCNVANSRLQWLRGLRRGSATAGVLGLQVQTPMVAWMSFSYECCVRWADLFSRGIYIYINTFILRMEAAGCSKNGGTYIRAELHGVAWRSTILLRKNCLVKDAECGATLLSLCETTANIICYFADPSDRAV